MLVAYLSLLATVTGLTLRHGTRAQQLLWLLCLLTWTALILASAYNSLDGRLRAAGTLPLPRYQRLLSRPLAARVVPSRSAAVALQPADLGTVLFLVRRHRPALDSQVRRLIERRQAEMDCMDCMDLMDGVAPVHAVHRVHHVHPVQQTANCGAWPTRAARTPAFRADRARWAPCRSRHRRYTPPDPRRRCC